jgi:hypothetical protein
MSTVTMFYVTRLGEAVIDREQAADDEAQYQREMRADLIHARINEIQAKRMAELSLDDLALALDELSTAAFVGCRESMRKMLLAHDPVLVHDLLGMIQGLLCRSSCDQANAEFAKLDEIKSENCH